MEQLIDGLQLVGFLIVSVTILAVLVALAIGAAIFLYMTDRKIVVVQRPKPSHESRAPIEV